MPSFSLLPGSEVESLVEYVKYLSIRGQMETELIRYVYDELGEDEEEDEEGNVVVTRISLDPEGDPEQKEVIMELLAEVVDGWESANEQIIVPLEEQIPEVDQRSPEELAASIEKGRELFYGHQGQLLHLPRPYGAGRWPARRLRHLEQSSQQLPDRSC